MLFLILLAPTAFSLGPFQVFSDFRYKLPLFPPLPCSGVNSNTECIIFFRIWALRCVLLLRLLAHLLWGVGTLMSYRKTKAADAI